MASRSLEAPKTVRSAAASAQADANMELDVRRRGQQGLYKALTKEDKVKVSISPMYSPYFGDNVCASICGFPIYVPCDGQTYEIPASYANIIHELIDRCDDQIRGAQQLNNVQENIEQYAGERQLIRRA